MSSLVDTRALPPLKSIETLSAPYKSNLRKLVKAEIENCSTHPHNIFFQLLVETGLIGIIYYIIFNILLFVFFTK